VIVRRARVTAALPTAKRAHASAIVTPGTRDSRAARASIASMPSARVIELETLRLRIINANACLSSFDGWDRWGKSSSDAAQVEQMESEAAAAQTDHTTATAALDALVGKLRTEAPDELAAWVAAHDALLAGYLASDEARGPYSESAAQSATVARAEWAEVITGPRACSDQGSYAETRDKAKYRELLGVDL